MSEFDLTLEGKAAIVTGASRGYGFCTARQLAEGGAKVALFARSQDALNNAAAEIGPNALPVSVDIANPDSVRAGFDAVREAFGRLDILVNNAALGRVFKVDEASDEDLRAMVDVNFLGHVYCCREAIKLMKASGGGYIANVSSEASRNPFPQMSLYAATKAGLETFSAALRNEVQFDNIHVTLFRTGMSSAGGEDSLRASGFLDGIDPEKVQSVMAEWEKGGFLHYAAGAVGGMDPDAVARSIVHTVTRGGGANIDMIEIRAL